MTGRERIVMVAVICAALVACVAIAALTNVRQHEIMTRAGYEKLGPDAVGRSDWKKP